MTDSSLAISPPTTRGQLNEALDQVVTAAVENDVDVSGGYQVQYDGTGINYGIEVYRVARASDD